MPKDGWCSLALALQFFSRYKDENSVCSLPTHMEPMVAKFTARHGWAEGPQNAGTLVSQLEGKVPEAALDSIQARGDGSLTFLCHNHCLVILP